MEIRGQVTSHREGAGMCEAALLPAFPARRLPSSAQ